MSRPTVLRTLALAALPLALIGCGGADEPAPRPAPQDPPEATADPGGGGGTVTTRTKATMASDNRGQGNRAAEIQRQRASLAERLKQRLAQQKAAKEKADQEKQKLTGEDGSEPPPPLREGPVKAPPKLRSTYCRFEQMGRKKKDRGVGLRVRCLTNLPEGGRVDVVVHYGGQPLPAFRRRATIGEGRVELAMGPVKGYLSSGIYEVVLTLDPSRQSAAFLKTLAQRFGGRAPRETVRIVQKIKMRSETLMEGEVKAAVLHYEAVSSTAKTLFDSLDETRAAIADKARFYDGDRFEHVAFKRWVDGWTRRIRQMRGQHVAFRERYATPPHPELVGRISVLWKHLEQLGGMRWKEIARALAGDAYTFRDEERQGDGFITPADLERSVRQVLVEIDVVVKGATDEPARAAAAVEALAKLAEGPAYEGERDPERKREMFLAWQAEVEAQSTGLVLSQHWDAMVDQVIRLGRGLLEQHGSALARWHQEESHELPKDFVLPTRGPRVAPERTLSKVRQLLEEKTRTAPEIKTPKEPADDGKGDGEDGDAK